MVCSEPVQRGWWVDSLKSWRTPSPSDAFTVSFIRTVCATVPLRDEFTGYRSCSLVVSYLHAYSEMLRWRRWAYLYSGSHMTLGQCSLYLMNFTLISMNLDSSTTLLLHHLVSYNNHTNMSRCLGYTNILISWQ